MSNELSFQDLRRLEVINGSDGRRMGHIIDLIFSADGGKVKGIVLPYGKKNIFSKSQDLFLPWSCVQKIGEDVILVEIEDLCSGAPVCRPGPYRKSDRPDKYDDRSHGCGDGCGPGGHGGGHNGHGGPGGPGGHGGNGRDCDDGGGSKCDGICEKCMLFDCSRRWESFAAST